MKEFSDKEYTPMHFDTHKSVKSLLHHGFKAPQAESIVELLSQSRDYDLSRVATKEQVTKLESSTKEQFTQLESFTKEGFIKVNHRIDILDTKVEAIKEHIKEQMVTKTTFTEAIYSESLCQTIFFILIRPFLAASMG